MYGLGSLVDHTMPWATLGLTEHYVTAAPLTTARLRHASWVRLLGGPAARWHNPKGAAEWEQVLHAAVGVTPHGHPDVIVARRPDRVPATTPCLKNKLAY